ncbi:MAG: alpha/beta fold hydrolase [Anaerolineae bacterium]
MTRQPLGVLIVHGFSSSLDCVSGVVPPLQALGLSTRMPALAGHGAQSPEALRGVVWHDWVADAQAALEDLLTEVQQAIVFGHSMGGLVTLTLAAEQPEVIDSIVVAAAAVQLTSPLAPGRPLHFLAPLVARVRNRLDMPPTYADPELADYDTNYPWVPADATLSFLEFGKMTRRRLPEIQLPTLIMQSRNDSTVAPESAEIIYRNISTPADQKHIVWLERTEHEMFRDCEREAAIETVVNWVRMRVDLAARGRVSE